jgi:heme/copper-type cytochrome/quinol oxidase subunit 3
VSERARRARKEVIDVLELPSYAFGHRSIMWWATAGMIAIEATFFAFAAFTYFYVWTRTDVWPPASEPPYLFWGTLNLLVMLASLVPNQAKKKFAEKEDLAGVRKAMGIGLCFAAAFLTLRVFEFTALNVRWDSNAYGSAVWILLGLHTLHLLTDFYDTLMLWILMGRGPLEGKRFVDVSENSFYWYFVVIAWVPIYLIVYWGPRLL